MRAYFGVLPEANYDGDAVLAFLKQLRRTLRAPLALIWDQLRGHRFEPVAGWLAQHRHHVRAYLLPAYAPELNPVELIWGYAKTNPLANFAPVELHDLVMQTQLATYAIADDVNDGGFIAGYGDRVAPGMPPFIDPSVVDAGFLFHPDFGFYVLPSLPMTIPWLTADCRARALNERRSNGRVQVVGYCTTGNGARAVRWDVTVQAERLPFP